MLSKFENLHWNCSHTEQACVPRHCMTWGGMSTSASREPPRMFRGLACEKLLELISRTSAPEPDNLALSAFAASLPSPLLLSPPSPSSCGHHHRWWVRSFSCNWILPISLFFFLWNCAFELCFLGIGYLDLCIRSPCLANVRRDQPLGPWRVRHLRLRLCGKRTRLPCPSRVKEEGCWLVLGAQLRKGWRSEPGLPWRTGPSTASWGRGRWCTSTSEPPRVVASRSHSLFLLTLVSTSRRRSRIAWTPTTVILGSASSTLTCWMSADVGLRRRCYDRIDRILLHWEISHVAMKTYFYRREIPRPVVSMGLVVMKTYVCRRCS